MNSNQIMQTVLQIAGLPGKNDKQHLLALAMEDSQFSKVMLHTYNPFITYGVRPARRLPEQQKYYQVWDDTTWSLLDKLADRSLTGDNAKNEINAQYASLDELSAELLWRVLNKDMKAGFSENSINKVSKDFIPSFPYMRCSLPKDANMREWEWSTGQISQIKADGMFFNADIERYSVSLSSRQGQPFPASGFGDLALNFTDAFLHLLDDPVYADGVQTHGELLVEDDQGNVLPREVGNGLINKLIDGTFMPEGYKLTALLWDVIPKSCAVKKGKFDQPYLNRLRTLNSSIGMLKAKRVESLINIIETRVVRSYDEAMAHYYDARRRKLEGTIAKKVTMIWKDGTSKDQVKLKQEVPVELEVYDFEEGKEGAKTELTFGSLKCRTKDHLLKVNVGSGFSDELRAEINSNRFDWIGAIITVKSNEIMYAKRGKVEHSLFLPVFIERRFDKSEADTFAEVEAQFEAAVKNEALAD